MLSASTRGALWLVLLLAAGPAAALQPQDVKACVGKDHPLFSRMPGYYLLSPSACTGQQFGRFEFAIDDASKRTVKQPVEGRLYKLAYSYRGDGPSPSGIQVGRNYANAATASGGEILHSDSYGTTTVRFTQGGKQTWATVYTRGSTLNLVIVEPEPMKQDVTANVDALKGGLSANGHVELLGIYFDTGKSDLKPESDASLAELEKLLKASPQLALWVVGHTDSVGGLDSNMALSQTRAAAVVRALVEKRGVEPSRLAPFGAGPYAPVATNASEDGRARNRRVELVAR